MKTISTVGARESIAEIINEACYGKKRTILTRRGKPVAAIVCMEDFKFLEESKNKESGDK